MRLEKTTSEEISINIETRKGLFSYIIHSMNTDFFENNMLECNKNNPQYIQYLTGLKDLFQNISKMVESGKLDESKEFLMDKYGVLSPKIDQARSEINKIFFGPLKDSTMEIYLRYSDIYQELSDERVSELTGYDKEISINRLKLFIMQEIRDIENILNQQ
ncbi:MAG: hypothetical protein UW60_C0024G0009 [Candidatus Woesebacteria bacterium GW2011_GWA2_44_33]|uniref:Uncharacterized protein n=2 Tax=Microgenomates group TaxID=1794810 RepID=A0A0G1J543_9BACT|nr:MAG: hypothetical protein UW60_C0024G0009 [Candidatus Woesebacteria bacterium GW2011_GWA2_44_33]